MKKITYRFKNLSLFTTFLCISCFASSDIFAAKKYTPDDIRNMAPPTANPWLSMMPAGAKTDWDYWNMKKGMESRDRMQSMRPASASIVQSGNSWLPFTTLPRFGTGFWQESSLEIKSEFTLPPPIQMTQKAEDEGSIPLATETGLVSGNAVVFNGIIGDGKFGSAGTNSGDFDFYAIRNVKAGQLILVDVDTPEPFGGLDSFVEIRNSKGEGLIVNNAGDPSISRDSLVRYEVKEDGDYFISIASSQDAEMDDPFVSSSGFAADLVAFGESLNEGPYKVTIALNYFEEKDFIFVLSPGDVFGASIMGKGDKLTLIDPINTKRQESTQDLNLNLPTNSPLPAGRITINHVVDEIGVFKLTARSMEAGPFTLRLEAAIPPLAISDSDNDRQIIFIDFDGATVDLAESLSPKAAPGTQVKTLSPLSSFLPRWGLTPADEDLLIDKILLVLQESLVHDIEDEGDNLDFHITLLNSRDHRDPFGRKNVSRVIVGGSVAELGINTIGIAQSIDVGNFNTEETAFLLLDALSEPDKMDFNSLNSVKRASGISMLDLVAVGLGETIAHEAGHYLGNWHTDRNNTTRNIMDQGGNFSANILGIGADFIFGTADDINVRFGRDNYAPKEGLIGIEDTMSSISWGATTNGYRNFE